jgi:hypothetical protein
MSLKGDKYETHEEIQFRLNNTVVMYDGKPVYITQVRQPEDLEEANGKEIARVFFSELPYNGRGKEERKYLSSRKFDLSPFKMGYVNYKGEALFCSRKPIRQNQQGLSAKTLSITDIKGRVSDNASFGNLIAHQSFADMVAGKYPGFAEVGDMLENKESSSVAVSRCFAFLIDHDLEALLLMHKGTKCGLAMKGDKALRLPPKYHFLREEAEECRIPLA